MRSMANSTETVAGIKAQDLRALTKEYFYEQMNITTGYYPTKDEIFDFMINQIEDLKTMKI